MNKKIVLITGSARGIGKETTIAIAKAGNIVIATQRDPESSYNFSDQSDDIRQNILIRKLDVTDKKTIDETIDEVVDKYGRLDVVINNAGYGLFAPVELASDVEIQKQFDVNVFGVIRVIQKALPQMRKQRSGHIINISSIAGIVSNVGLGIYSATKHALEAISASLAATVFPWNIKVTVVQPGPTQTEFAEEMPVAGSLQKENPYKRLFELYHERMKGLLKEGQPPQEIAELILMIINEKNPDFRYQTSPAIKETVAQFVQDPSGNKWVDEQKEKFANWF